MTVGPFTKMAGVERKTTVTFAFPATYLLSHWLSARSVMTNESHPVLTMTFTEKKKDPL